MSPARLLTGGLFYPAIVGSAFVQLAQRLSLYGSLEEAAKSAGFWWAIVLLVFFTACFVGLHYTPKKKYTFSAFRIDFAEVLLVFFAYQALGLFDTSKVREPSYIWLFSVLFLIFVIQHFWSEQAAPVSFINILNGLRLAGILGFLIFAIIALGVPKLWITWHWVPLIFLAALIVAYIFNLYERRAELEA